MSTVSKLCWGWLFSLAVKALGGMQSWHFPCYWIFSTVDGNIHIMRDKEWMGCIPRDGDGQVARGCDVQLGVLTVGQVGRGGIWERLQQVRLARGHLLTFIHSPWAQIAPLFPSLSPLGHPSFFFPLKLTMTAPVSKGELPLSSLLAHLNPDAGLFYFLIVIFMHLGGEKDKSAGL